MNGILRISFLITIFLFIACNELQFEPKDSNYKDIPIDIPQQEITISAGTDTLYMFGETKIYFNLDLKGKKFEKINIYIDSAYYKAVTSQNYMILNTEKFSNGNHILTLELVSHSGTNSLADLLDSEFIIYRKNITMTIDNLVHVKTFHIIGFNIENGILRINFDRYPYANFQGYLVYKLTIENNTIVESLKDTIFDSQTNYWLDNEYQTGRVAYRVNLLAANQIVKGKAKAMVMTVPSVTGITINNQNKAQITWTRSPFYNSFSNYQIERCIADTIQNVPEPVSTIYSVTDTNYTDDDFGFGNLVYYRILTENKKGEQLSSQWYPVFLGNKIDVFSNIKYIPALNSYYVWLWSREFNDYMIFRFNGDFQRVATLNAENFDILPDGSRAFVIGFTEITEVDPLTFAEIKTIPTTDIHGYESAMTNNFVIAKPAKLIYAGYKYISPTMYIDKIFDVDLDSKSILASMDFIYLLSTDILSCTMDGRYVAIANEAGQIFDLSSGDFNPVATFSSKYNFLFAADGQHFIETTGTSIVIKEIASSAIINEFPADELIDYPMLDTQTNYLAGNNHDRTRYYIYNPENGSKLKTLNLSVAKEGAFLFDRFFIANSTLFSSSGYSMTLNF